MVRPPLHRPFIAIALVIAGAVAGVPAPPVHAEDLIFSDGFESGDLTALGVPVAVQTVRLVESSLSIGEGSGTLELVVALGEEVVDFFCRISGRYGKGMVSGRPYIVDGDHGPVAAARVTVFMNPTGSRDVAYVRN